MRSVFTTMSSYPGLPEPDEEFSSWVTPKSSWYDPHVANAAFNKYMNELEYADAMGIDGIGANEHHNSAYTMQPSPNLIAAAIARRTRNAAIAVLGNTLAAYNPPTRVAEEMAMIDAISGGRLISGFVFGTPMDTAYCSSINPSELRARYEEAADLIIKAWTSREPFEFNGRFNQLRYVNPWPRVVQDPHPPIWCPSGGSPDTWDFTVSKGFLYSYLSFTGFQSGDKINRGYWATVKEHGAEPNPFQLCMNQFIFVAESLDEARDLYAESVDYFWRVVLKFDPRFTGPPGYLSERTIRHALKSHMAEAARGRAGAAPYGGTDTFDALVANGSILAGHPDEISAKLHESCTKFRIGNLVTNLAIGNMSEEVTKYNIRMYTQRVMPNVRPLFEDEWEHKWWPKPLEHRVGVQPLEVELAGSKA
jgi:alkanesulfonate monooxygenase SsuD/methylene tetrahydromethanopterin reductase-like flavin-dependent oxidoreductase (luciferase family)